MTKRPSSRWSIAEAKAHLSNVVDSAVAHGPQVITRRGKATAVLVSAAEWNRRERRGSLVEFFARAPTRGVKGLSFERSREGARKLEL